MKSNWKRICLPLLAIIMLIPHNALATLGIEVQSISSSVAEDRGDQWLLVIGIDAYAHWPRLKTAVNDARSVRDVLLSRYHFDKDHLIELYDEQATRKEIFDKLLFLAENTDQDDSLFIFFAGHGHLDSITKEGSWIPVEGGTDDSSAWITNHDIKNYLQIDSVKARHILLVSDSCFSGDFLSSHQGKRQKVTDEEIKKTYNIPSRRVITSGGLEPVTYKEFGNNSIFSHFLVKTLKQNQQPFLVPSDFFPDIKAGVLENGEQYPRFGSFKETNGQQGGGEIVLFLKQEAMPEGFSVETAHREQELEPSVEVECAEETGGLTKEAQLAGVEEELTKLDNKIEVIVESVTTSSTQSSYYLDDMLDVVEQKEERLDCIEELEREWEAEEVRRLAEAERLQAEKRAKRIAAIIEDIRKYKQTVSLGSDNDLKASAWKTLTDKYPAAKGLIAGDIVGFKSRVDAAEIIDRDDRFIAYDNGTVKDAKTGLTWAAADNGEDITWEDAREYCKNYRGGGFTDWRMPTPDELAGLYDQTRKNRQGYSVTRLIDISSCCPWASLRSGSLAVNFHFSIGVRNFSHQFLSVYARVLPVRGSPIRSAMKAED